MFIKIGNFSSYLLFPILTGVFYICFVLLFNSYMVGQRKISFLCRMLLIETGNFLIIFVELVSMKLSLILLLQKLRRLYQNIMQNIFVVVPKEDKVFEDDFPS